MIKLTVEELKLRYGAVEVLKGVSLKLEQGKILVLLGASGSGKTTLLRAIAGFEKPFEGRVTIGEQVVFDGKSNVEVPTEKRSLGLVFQSYALWPHRTIDQNIRYALKLRKLSEAEQVSRSTEVLKHLGLDHLKDRFPHQLSGGQQQRVAVARALVYDPPVILMDEPLSNLDARLRDEAKAWLRGLVTERNLAAIVVTHDQAEALALGDHIALLSNGRLEQIDTPEAIYNNPSTLVSAEFFGSNNRLSGTVAEVGEGSVLVQGPSWAVWGKPMKPVCVGDKVAGVVRVEAVKLSSASSNQLTLPLKTSMFAGERWQHAFDLDGAIFTVHGPDRLEPQEYRLSFDPKNFWVFPAG